jgi:hypothetical protein
MDFFGYATVRPDGPERAFRSRVPNNRSWGSPGATRGRYRFSMPLGATIGRRSPNLDLSREHGRSSRRYCKVSLPHEPSHQEISGARSRFGLPTWDLSRIRGHLRFFELSFNVTIVVRVPVMERDSSAAQIEWLLGRTAANDLSHGRTLSALQRATQSCPGPLVGCESERLEAGHLPALI